MSEEHFEEIKTFEDFNKAIDESHDEGCGFCFSLHHYAHLDPGTRKLAYLGYIDDSSYYQVLADELEKREPLPMDDNIYWMVTTMDPMVKLEAKLSERIMIQVLRRANEMVQKKMPAAWVAVRAYGWMDKNDPMLLTAFLEDTDDLDVWQVVLQTTSWDTPRRESYKSLCLSSMRNITYKYAIKALEMGDEIKTYVVAVNGVKALAALQDPRVVEVMERLPRHNLDRVIREDVEPQIAYLTKTGQLDFIPILEKVLSFCQDKL